MSSMSSQQPSRQRPAAAGQHPGPDHDVAGEVILGVDTHKDIHAGAVISSLGVLPARRVTSLTGEIGDLDARLAATIGQHAPQLPARNGVGPGTAAALLIAAGDNPGRLHSGASFAALCGVSPVEASSGKTQRLRLNRGGNRQANAALHRITLSRLRWDPATRDYAERRARDGKTRREAIRCLKRYIARELYPLITSPPAQTIPVAAATAS